ncbi:MAG TPA: ATP-binding protein [Dongiaceae bacterium]|nr:ATP-binding protein [Dongiaceae bacterium]
MNEDRLCVLVCESFKREIESISASSAYPDVEIAAFSDRCAHPPLDWADIRQTIGRPERFRHVCIIGGCCLAKLDSPPGDLLHTEITRLNHCFGLLIGEYALDRYVQEGAYLVTPGWLETWRQRIDEWGFDQTTAREFFGECCRKIILLDTGVSDSFHAPLEEFARFIDRPYEVLPTGLDLMRLRIESSIRNWRCERESSTCSETLDTSRRQVADYAMAFDLLSSITLMDDEEEVVQRILAFYSILFDADDLAYVPMVDGEPGKVTRYGFSGKGDDEQLRKEAALLDTDYRLLESQSGFLLKICHNRQHLGVIRTEGITLARYRDQYLNLAISTAGVCGLALNNARSFQRIREITRQLQASEEALAKANEELELRVAKRTEELEKSRSELKMQNEKLLETYRRLEQETAERIRTMEELRQKDQLMIQQSRQAALGEMIGNIAHQWRQPLNSLGLLVQQAPLFYELGQVNKEFLDTNARKSMELIQHMSRTIDDFRNYFKPDKEKVKFRVQEAVEKALSLMEGCLNNQRISIEVDLQDDPLIYGYPNEYSQVLLNILINAKDALIERKIAMPKVLFTIGTHEKRAVVTITDNAGGIPKEIIGNIFAPYFTTKGPQEGTGVGLFMSKIIIEKNMGGFITVRNVDGGAEFRIEC